MNRVSKMVWHHHHHYCMLLPFALFKLCTA